MSKQEKKQAKKESKSISDMYMDGLETIQKANKRLMKAIRSETTETIQEIKPALRRRAQTVLKSGSTLFDKLSEMAGPKEKE
ncbi:MAG: hypothetical protein WC375_11120 [Methanomassiliicoccales archaeon]|jgi:hypothetical protein